MFASISDAEPHGMRVKTWRVQVEEASNSQQVIVKVVLSALTSSGEQFDENAPLRANEAAAIQDMLKVICVNIFGELAS